MGRKSFRHHRPRNPPRARPPGGGIEEVRSKLTEPRYACAHLARTVSGRIWAPVLINGQGPFRLVLDTGASKSHFLPESLAR
jgi:predicted aspartyl protease